MLLPVSTKTCAIFKRAVWCCVSWLAIQVEKLWAFCLSLFLHQPALAYGLLGGLQPMPTVLFGESVLLSWARWLRAPTWPTIREGRNKSPFLLCIGNAAPMSALWRGKHCLCAPWRGRMAWGLQLSFWPCPARLWRLLTLRWQPPKASRMETMDPATICPIFVGSYY